MKLMPECWLNNKANDNLVSLSCHPCCFIIAVVLIISYPFPSTFCPIPLLFLLHLQLFLLLHHIPPLFFFPHPVTPLVSPFLLQGSTHFTFSLSSPELQTPGLGAIPPSCLLAQTSLAHRLQHRCFCLGNRNIFSSSLKVIFTKTFSVRSIS